jgi:hypothetical protein
MLASFKRYNICMTSMYVSSFLDRTSWTRLTFGSVAKGGEYGCLRVSQSFFLTCHNGTRPDSKTLPGSPILEALKPSKGLLPSYRALFYAANDHLFD